MMQESLKKAMARMLTTSSHYLKAVPPPSPTLERFQQAVIDPLLVMQTVASKAKLPSGSVNKV